MRFKNRLPVSYVESMLVSPFWLFCSHQCVCLTELIDFLSVLEEASGEGG